MEQNNKSDLALDPKIQKYYEMGEEDDRLAQLYGKLEKQRTSVLLERYLESPPKRIIDVGGGSGPYACWLAEKGYYVELLDPMPLHLEQAKKASALPTRGKIASFTVADARKLNSPDSSFDYVLLFGPLYHLTERSDRIKALTEANRVLKSGGQVFAVGISRLTSTLDALFHGGIDDPEFKKIIKRDLVDGQHRNECQNQDYFTTSFFHKPEILKNEIEESGFVCEKLFAIEGPGWLLQNFTDIWNDKVKQAELLEAIRWLEEEESILEISAHIMAVARKL
ncbi:class I SAM-dependent methyltransferase [Candidatus Riflebacteria bacterium]